jgi:hypothetical protein
MLCLQSCCGMLLFPVMQIRIGTLPGLHRPLRLSFSTRHCDLMLAPLSMPCVITCDILPKISHFTTVSESRLSFLPGLCSDLKIASLDLPIPFTHGAIKKKNLYAQRKIFISPVLSSILYFVIISMGEGAMPTDINIVCFCWRSYITTSTHLVIRICVSSYTYI